MSRKNMTPPSSPFKVVDLFAGPGGLAEGFSSIVGTDGKRAFEIAMSVEKDSSAHRTLRLRAFTRQFPRQALPAEYYALLQDRITIDELASLYPEQWSAASREAIRATLGSPEDDERVYARLDELIAATGPDGGKQFIVIGGPPCQAYSLIGRARNAGQADYRPEDDNRHFLYEEYIGILHRLQPAAFVMENVKGMLSSTVGKRRIFERVLEDLRVPGGDGHEYTLLALAPSGTADLYLSSAYQPRDFIVRAEEFGVPQARHRVFVIGVRSDLVDANPDFLSLRFLENKGELRTVDDVIGELPKLRSGLSRDDSAVKWESAVRQALRTIIDAMRKSDDPAAAAVIAAANKLVDRTGQMSERPRNCTAPLPAGTNDPLLSFLQDPALPLTINHETRGHMPADLARYLFCSLYARVTNGRSPRAQQFPPDLAPSHASWTSGKFADRFKVQVSDRPSTTITSHISKDGHYYIHPDPEQCRSLTVREAARLQTFPDNYLFLGNRTEQYIQVGNAVPPYLASRIAAALLSQLQCDRTAAGLRADAPEVMG